MFLRVTGHFHDVTDDKNTNSEIKLSQKYCRTTLKSFFLSLASV